MGMVFGIALMAGWKQMMRYRSTKRIAKEILDAISEAKVLGDDHYYHAWGTPWGYGYDGSTRDWDDVVAEM
ncbi:hypothetical protein I3843_12G077100 [Carya illinoinensis]|nr:hypothetical protein I3760_05G109600 [Carya illinoinensis]KAG7952804.1 hypothetical protein I3843_12G077100 [Carya illinoinensis]